jgi:predicted small metal-binding protein
VVELELASCAESLRLSAFDSISASASKTRLWHLTNVPLARIVGNPPTEIETAWASAQGSNAFLLKVQPCDGDSSTLRDKAGECAQSRALEPLCFAKTLSGEGGLCGNNVTPERHAETVEDVLNQCGEHAKTAHGMSEISAELLEKVKSAIHDEGAATASV